MSVKPYDPQSVERGISRRWERAKVFSPPAARRRGRTSFAIVIPPPNITGSLHVGHALNGAMQDVLIRYHRMRGDDTVWVPGTDHAGIATQNVVEKELRSEGKTRQDLGREKFLERVWAWKERYGETITQQIRRLGCSCDWSRARFTLDAEYVRAVQEAFIHYAHRGLIYRGDRIVNWCPRCASSISDLEVRYEEKEDVLYAVRYPLTKRTGNRKSGTGTGHIVVATTRPETMLGDAAVAVHPDDERYTALVGKRVRLPLTDREIPIVADRAVDPHFGTGAVKVTPAHDATDAEIAKRHGLPTRNVIGEDGQMTAAVPAPYRGLSADAAREQVLTDLRARGLLVQETPHRHSVGSCERCGTVVQPLVSKQWFVRMKPLAQPAIDVVEEGLITFHPPRWKKPFLAWLRGVKDWCISRQLWWGHRLPVWYCQAGKRNSKLEYAHIVFSTVKPRRCPECGGREFVQDPDVLDTWFSSALWPLAVFGWPEATADLARFYPTTVLTTAPEILHLWVARMVFSGLEFTNRKTYLPATQYGKTNRAGQVPFRDVIIHQTVLNIRGQRMSKSLGTGIDPLELIEKYGADATRFGILVQLHGDQQALRFDEHAVRTGRNVVNKLWNIGRFLERQARSRRHEVGGKQRRAASRLSSLAFDTWIQGRLADVTEEVTNDLNAYRFGEALRTLHAFLWDEFADWYVEVCKVPEMTAPRVARDVFVTLLRLFHPFLPFVTEELWRTFGDHPLLTTASWPMERRTKQRSAGKTKALGSVAIIQAVVRHLRSVRTLLGIPAGQNIPVRIWGEASLLPLFPVVMFLAGCRTVANGARDAGAWVPLPRVGRVRMALQRDALAGLDLTAHLEAARRRAAQSRVLVQSTEQRLETMRKGAPTTVVAQAEERLIVERRDLRELERAVELLSRFLTQSESSQREASTP